MKIRTAFVANSSSSSFVLGKNFMTDEQIKKFNNFLTFIDLFYENSIHEFDELCTNDDYEYYLSLMDKDIEDVLRKDNDLGYLDYGRPYESKYYFHGEVDNHIFDLCSKYLNRIGVNREYIGG